MSAFETDAEAILPSREPHRRTMAGAADHPPTLLAAGILAYVAETMLHEGIGHGGVCLAQGNSLTLLAPLFMRCSQVSPLLTAAGPAANVIGAAIAYTWLRLAPPRNALPALLLWLSFAFNALIACGYLVVGAVTGFGDWASLFAWVTLPILWRLPAALIGTAGYMSCLTLAASLFRRVAGSSPIAEARLWRRSVIPATGAAVAAALAEIAGGRMQPLPLALALGCTLAVGFSLTSQDAEMRRPDPAARDLGPVACSPWLIAAATLTAAIFVAVIGPGLAFQSAP